MATEIQDRERVADRYENDFYAWALEQARQLRVSRESRPNLPLDFEHLIEEVEDLADNKLAAVKSQLSRIMAHFLKLEFSPAAAPRRKCGISIIDAQNEIDNDMTPSIRRKAGQDLGRVYEGARRLAAAELRAHDEPEAAASLPEACPYTLDQLLDETWRPTSRHRRVDEPL